MKNNNNNTRIEYIDLPTTLKNWKEKKLDFNDDDTLRAINYIIYINGMELDDFTDAQFVQVALDTIDCNNAMLKKGISADKIDFYVAAESYFQMLYTICLEYECYDEQGKVMAQKLFNSLRDEIFFTAEHSDEFHYYFCRVLNMLSNVLKTKDVNVICNAMLSHPYMKSLFSDFCGFTKTQIENGDGKVNNN